MPSYLRSNVHSGPLKRSCVSVAAIGLVTWLLGMPALLFTDVGWTWWIGAMVLASGLYSASTLSDASTRVKPSSSKKSRMAFSTVCRTRRITF